MKFLLPGLVLFAIACNQTASKEPASSDEKTETAPEKPVDANISYPYNPTYSSSFEMGNPQLSKIVLDMWKDYDNNTLDNSAKNFADSVTMHLEGSKGTRLSRDATLSEAKKYRATQSDVKSVIHAFVPLKSTDKNEDWVLVWGTEYATMNGKKDSTLLHELWLFDQNNKIKEMRQFRYNYIN